MYHYFISFLILFLAYFFIACDSSLVVMGDFFPFPCLNTSLVFFFFSCGSSSPFSLSDALSWTNFPLFYLYSEQLSPILTIPSFIALSLMPLFLSQFPFTSSFSSTPRTSPTASHNGRWISRSELLLTGLFSCLIAVSFLVSCVFLSCSVPYVPLSSCFPSFSVS